MAIVWELDRAYQVDLVINYLNRRIVIIRFGEKDKQECKQTDSWIEQSRNNEIMKRNAAIFKVETKDVPELVARYSLSGSSTLVFFYDNSVFHRLSGEELRAATQGPPPKSFHQVMQDICQAKRIPLRNVPNAST